MNRSQKLNRNTINLTKHDTYMATLVHDELVLEQEQEVVGLLVLHNADLHWGTAVLVVEVLGPQSAGSLLVLMQRPHGYSRQQSTEDKKRFEEQHKS